MSTQYTFDVTLRPWGTVEHSGIVEIDTHALYGAWEYKNGTEGGGLWFDRLANGSLELVDFDGAGVLPRAIVDAMRSAGFILDETFNP